MGPQNTSCLDMARSIYVTDLKLVSYALRESSSFCHCSLRKFKVY